MTIIETEKEIKWVHHNSILETEVFSVVNPILSFKTNGDNIYHIIKDDDCYLLMIPAFSLDDGLTPLNGFKPTSWIFPEALEAFKELN